MSEIAANLLPKPLNALWVEKNLAQAPGFANLNPAVVFHLTPSWSVALEQLDQQDFDLIFISSAFLETPSDDLIAPFERQGIPAIAILESDNPDLATQALDWGAVDYLLKAELDRSTLQRTLRYALRFRQLREQAAKPPDQQQEMLVSSLNVLADPVFIKDECHRFLFVNQAFCQLLGRSFSEIIGRSDYDFFPPEQAAVFWEKDELAMQTGKPNENEEELTHSQGKVQVISTKKSVFEMPDGQKILVGVIRDLTQYKQQERALIDSEKRFAQLAANVPGMIYQFCLTSEGRRSFIYVSEGCRELYGVEPEIVKQNAEFLFQTVHPDDLPMLEQSIVISAQTLQPWRYEWRTLSPTGDLRWLKGASNPDLQANGDIIWNGLLTEITEQKLAEHERDRFFTLSLDLLCIASFEGYFKRLNPSWTATLGYSETELLSLQFIELVHPEDRQDTLQALQNLAQGVKILKFENRYRSQDGSYRWLSWVAAPFAEEGLIYAVARDISDRKQAEEELREKAQQLKKTIHKLTSTQAQLVQTEKMASLGQLVAGVAHEINNPVSFISGNITPAMNYACDLLKVIELYQQHYPHPPAKLLQAIESYDLEFLSSDFPQLLQSMQEGATRITEIVASLRNFSRLDEAHLKAVNLHQGIESTLMILQHRLKAQNEQIERPAIQVIKEFANLPLVECHPGQINQVFMNILSNAIDALEEYWMSRSGSEAKRMPTLSIRTTTQKAKDPQGGKLATIQIRDNGKGISPTLQTRLFDPFFTTKPVGKGTGLGLYISHQIIVDKHQGSLTCRSEFGKGTEFKIQIPIRTST